MRYMIPMMIVSAALFALDYYVYRRWRRFAKGRFEWTLPVYSILMFVMPLALPLYLYLFSWWEVEPRFARAFFFGFWALYYLPKAPIAMVLFAKDVLNWGRGLVSSSRGRQDPSNDQDASTGASTVTRAEFLRRMGWTAAAIPFVATGYGVFRTLYNFNIHRIDVPIAGLPRAFDGLTIAQLSDLHAGSLFSEAPMREAVSIIHQLKPDLIAVTGDFVNHDVAEMPLILPGLSELNADLGVFGCLGNHDHYADTNRLVDQVGSTPVDLLVNEHRTLEVDGANLHIIGTDNTGFRQHYGDLPRAVAGLEADDDSVQILLAHDPTFWDHKVLPNHSDIELMLCGHTHGGQFGVEFGPIRWSLASMRYERWAGLYSEPRSDGSAQFLYVNRGLGTVGPPMRLGIRPEVTLLTLRRA